MQARDVCKCDVDGLGPKSPEARQAVGHDIGHAGDVDQRDQGVAAHALIKGNCLDDAIEVEGRSAASLNSLEEAQVIAPDAHTRGRVEPVRPESEQDEDGTPLPAMR